MLFLCAAVAPPAAAFAQVVPPSSAPAVVSAGQQRMIDELIAAINAGTEPDLDAWITRYAVLRPTKGADSWKDWFGRISRSAGGLTLDRIEPPRPDGEIRIWVRTGRGSATRRFSLFSDPAGTGRASDFLIAVWPTPYTGELVRTPASDEKLGELVRDRVAFGATRDEFSGAVLLASRGRPVASAAAGMAELAGGQENTVDTRFHIGSIGKMFTAVAIGRLIQEGRLRFDTKLAEVLPDYPDLEAAQAITIAHLLSHSSGISLPHLESTSPADAEPDIVRDSVARIAARPLAFAPGTRASYSNEGYTLLGAVLEAVTGESYYDVIQSYVFDPAGMTNTSFDRPGELNPNTATGYRYGRDDALGVLPREPNTPFLQDRGGPSGGAYSTVGDLTKFLNALRDGRLVSPEVVEALLTAEPNGLPNYGKGFFVMPAAGKRLVGHSGGGPNSGINADAMIVWETGWSFAIASNYDAPAAQALSSALATAAVFQVDEHAPVTSP